MADLLRAFTNDDWEGIGEISELGLPTTAPRPAPNPQPSPVLISEDAVTETIFNFGVTSSITADEVQLSDSSQEPELIFSSTGTSSPDFQLIDLTVETQPANGAQYIPQEVHTSQVPDFPLAQSSWPSQQAQLDQLIQQFQLFQQMQAMYNAQFMHIPQPICTPQPIYNPEPTYNAQPMYNPEPIYNAQPMFNPEPMYSTHNLYPPQPMYGTQHVYAPQPTYKTQNHPNQPQSVPKSKPQQPAKSSPKKRTFEFLEPTVPVGFVANPNNHSRWEYDAAGKRHYMNAPKVKRQRSAK